MEKHLIEELSYYGQMLETRFHDMADIEFTVENGKLYILSGRIGRRNPVANIRIVLSMFCEGKMSVSDVFQKLPYQQIISLLDTKVIVNEHELKLLAQGLPACRGVVSAKVCYTALEAENFMGQKKEFILCELDIHSDDVNIIMSKYCKGVITARGGMTSHGAVICRGMDKPCVSGFGDFYALKELASLYENELTINGNNGSIYAGEALIRTDTANLEEIKKIYKLLSVVIKCNIITPEICPLIWRLWNVIVLNKRYGQDNTKRQVIKDRDKYVSFEKPEESEIESIRSRLQYIQNAGLLIEDLIVFLFDELSAQVPLGNHYLYTRPVLDPMDEIECSEKDSGAKYAGTQLTGIEFFHVNKFVDFLLDISNIKIYFSTSFYEHDTRDKLGDYFSPLNYLDYTNPNGESLIINTYKANKVAIYINDVLIPPNELPKVYHLLRRRKYHWSWYRDNNVSKNMIVDYLRRNEFQNGIKSKLYYLCEEMHLIHDNELTPVGVSLLEEKNVENSKNIDYILEEVLLRGYNDNSSECNDFSKLIQRKDFKDLIALELYEYYFWDERHEFDLQLLKEIVDRVASYFSDPTVIKQIESGFLQVIPSTIVLSSVKLIWSKLKTAAQNEKNSAEQSSGWLRIEKNMEKIDNEFKNHDYGNTAQKECSGLRYMVKWRYGKTDESVWPDG